MTDREIVVRILQSEGVAASETTISAALRTLEELTERELPAGSVAAIKGAPEALAATADAGWMNGLLTGNTPARARTKLEVAGLWDAVSQGGGFFGDHHGDRFGLAAACVAQLVKRPGVAVLIGDTPLDVQAAQAAGLPVVAVATGVFGAEELRPLRPDLLLPDLSAGRQSLIDFLKELA